MKNGKNDSADGMARASEGVNPNEGDVVVIEGAMALVAQELFAQLGELQKALKALGMLVIDHEARLETLGAPAGERVAIPKIFKEIFEKTQATQTGE